VTRLWAEWQRNFGSIPVGVRDFSLLYSLQTRPRYLPASYPLFTSVSSGSKEKMEREADHSSLCRPRDLYLFCPIHLQGVV
jgi:hypothetical protein